MHDSKETETTKHVSNGPGFRIFTSYRQDSPQLYHTFSESFESATKSMQSLFPFHRDRLVASANALEWSEVVDKLTGEAGLERLSRAVEAHLAGFIGQNDVSFGARKVRICISRFGVIDIDSIAIKDNPPVRDGDEELLPKKLSSTLLLPRPCKVVLDTIPTEPSLFTTHKTTAREHYDAARLRVGISNVPPGQGEVLLFNPAHEIMEGSLSTLYLFRNGRWITPPLQSGGNASVTRRFAISNGLCAEEIVMMTDLRDQEPVWISNGVRGFIKGALHLNG